MRTRKPRRLKFRSVNFETLYKRHRAQHPQFGINLCHVLALLLAWFGVYAAAEQTARHLGLSIPWIPLLVLNLLYFVLTLLKAPFRILLVVTILLLTLGMVVSQIPRLPAVAIPGLMILLPVGYQLKALSHRVWTQTASTKAFDRRLPPGRKLDLVLFGYELSLCLNYLLFRRQDWRL